MPLIDNAAVTPTSVAGMLWHITDVLKDSLSREAEAVLEASERQDMGAASEHRQLVRSYNRLIKLLDLTAAKASMIEAKTGPLGFFDLTS